MIYKGVEFKLSCYKCGGIKFENKHQNYNIIEDEYYLDNEKAKVKCAKCRLEDYIFNLVPKAEYHEELID